MPVIHLSKRGRVTLFWGSLFLNAVLIAAILLGPRFLHPGPPPPPHGMFKSMGRDLTGADQQAFEAIYQRYAEPLAQHHDRIRAAFDTIHKAVTADPADPEVVKAAHDAMRDARTALDDTIASFMAEIATGLSAEARQTLRLRPQRPPRP